MSMGSRYNTAAVQPRNIWRFFPWFIAAAMSVVIVVNFGMAYTALHTFPGIPGGGDGFDLSNHYNAVLDRVKQEAAFGWEVRAEIDPAGRPVVVLTDRSGAALSGAWIEATAQRPLGDPRTTDERFSEIAPGRYVGTGALEEKGQWDLLLSATAGGHELSATRRIVVR
jgi:nitrogen fixation protein FixH